MNGSRLNGTIALQGGGPFTANDDLDRRLLTSVGADGVVVLPTADAFERPERLVAAAVAGLLDRPRVVLTIPRWRGVVVRLVDAMPGLATRFLPMWMRDAQRRQHRWKRRIEAGQAP